MVVWAHEVCRDENERNNIIKVIVNIIIIIKVIGFLTTLSKFHFLLNRLGSPCMFLVCNYVYDQ